MHENREAPAPSNLDWAKSHGEWGRADDLPGRRGSKQSASARGRVR